MVPLPNSGSSFDTGQDVVVATNRCIDTDTGIVLFGDDPDFGTYLGVTSNAVLTTNGFCDVTTQVFSESGASYTEQGT